jgi:hypothetical protein
LPEQQPLGQVVPSQTQEPALQRCPAPQAGPAPHAHPPLVQLSADVALHPTQGEPPTPQVANADAVQTPLSATGQQPVQPVVVSQTQLPP